MSKIVDARQHSNSAKSGGLDYWRTYYCHHSSLSQCLKFTPIPHPRLVLFCDTPCVSSASWSHVTRELLTFQTPLFLSVYLGCFPSNTHFLVTHLLPPRRRFLCFHTLYKDSRLPFSDAIKATWIHSVLKLSLMSHDIVIYETAFSFPPLATL
jgi:hypothetical protein